MATNRWRGDAPAIAQVTTLTVGGLPSAGQVYGVTINGKTISYTAGSSATNASITTGLCALLVLNTTPPEFQEAIWTNDGVSVITATAATAGVPFTLTASATGAGTLTAATTTPSVGPNHADSPANWSLGSLPGTGDDVLIDGGADLLYGLGNLTAAALDSFRVKASFVGAIGLPVRNTSGIGIGSSAGYVEYRPREYPIGSGVPVTIGEGPGAGPNLVNLASAGTLALTIVTTGPAMRVSPVVNVSGCTDGALVATGGSIGLAADDDSLTGTITTMTISGTAAMTIGPSGSVTTISQDAGAIYSAGTAGGLTITGGAFTLTGTLDSVTATPALSGQVEVLWQTGGTIGSATFTGQGPGQSAPILDCSVDPRAKTLTNSTFTGGAQLYDPNKTVTLTNPMSIDRASLAASDLGPVFTIQRT